MWGTRLNFAYFVGLSGSLSLSIFASPLLAAPDTSVSSMMNSGDSVAQVSSISELTDVDPNTWAFQSLKSLVERYGCIEGYPSKKYLGNRPLSRYEFAAGLNSCLDKIGEQLAAASAPLATKEDLAVVQRLQEEFKSELVALRGRTEALEAKTKELEAQQFSTTTKLDGSVVMALTGGSAGGDVTYGGAFGALTGSTFDPVGCSTTTSTTRGTVTFSLLSNILFVPPVTVAGSLGPSGTFIPDNPATVPTGPFIDPGPFVPTGVVTTTTPGSLDRACSNSPTGGVRATSVPGSAANVTFVGRTRLNFRSTFRGKDELLIRLSGVTGHDTSYTFGNGSATVAPGSLFYAGTADGSTNPVQTNGSANVSFDKVRYVTPLFGDKFRFYVGPRLQLFELIDNNSYASNEEVDFSATSLLKNQLITRTVALPIINATTGAFVNQDIGFAGPGFGFDWNISPQFFWRASYIAADGGSSFGYGNAGITGGSTTLATELEFLPSQTSAIRLQYSRFIRNFLAGVAGDRPLFPSIGGGNFPVFAASDNLQSNNFGVNAEWAISPNVAIFGRYGFGSSTLQFTGNGVGPNGSNKDTFNFDATTWQFGFSFPDLFAQGNIGGISVGQPPRSTRTSISGNYFLPLLNNGTETDIEAYYSFRVNDRMTITPDLLFISQPGNINGNPSLFVGTVRAVYLF